MTVHKKILHFEDYPEDTENVLFRSRFSRAFSARDVGLVQEKTVRGFLDQISRAAFDGIILDIMAESPDPLIAMDSGQTVPSSLTGMELLTRIRAGTYGSKNKLAPVYMRTARGETRIRELCLEKGATEYFQAGTDDTKLIRVLKDALLVDKNA